jgi:hypothetical protein
VDVADGVHLAPGEREDGQAVALGGVGREAAAPSGEVERPDDEHVADLVRDAAHDISGMRDVAAGVEHLTRGPDAAGDGERRRSRVDDLDRHGTGAGRDLHGVDRRRRVGADVDRQDLGGPGRGRLLEDLEHVAGRRRRRRDVGAGRKTLVELGGRDVDALTVRVAIDHNRQRHDPDVVSHP